MLKKAGPPYDGREISYNFLGYFLGIDEPKYSIGNFGQLTEGDPGNMEHLFEVTFRWVLLWTRNKKRPVYH
jgi:hypothetical protein